MTSLPLSAAVAALGLVGACVIPPVRAGLGGGGGAGAVHARNSGGDVREGALATLAQFRVAVTPMALGSSTSRATDLSVGWTTDWTNLGRQARGFRHGPFAELVWFTRRVRGPETQNWRAGPTALVEFSGLARPNEDSPIGFGAAGGILVEYADVVRESTPIAGLRGDTAIGFAARVGVRHEDGGTHGTLIFSIEVRTPGAFGIPVPSPRPR